MLSKKRLNKRQLAVIDDMVSGELDEQVILEKEGVSRNVFNKWLSEESFTSEFDRRVRWLARQSELIIARYSGVAAAKLVQLVECEKDETARKACLDIISLPRLSERKSQLGSRRLKSSGGQSGDAEHRGQGGQLSPQVASRLLGVLAEEKRKLKGA